jgi:ABC-type Na+ efflux pump permease subunit
MKSKTIIFLLGIGIVLLGLVFCSLFIDNLLAFFLSIIPVLYGLSLIVDSFFEEESKQQKKELNVPIDYFDGRYK